MSVGVVSRKSVFWRLQTGVGVLETRVRDSGVVESEIGRWIRSQIKVVLRWNWNRSRDSKVNLVTPDF